MIVCISGGIGSGKTTFVAELARATSASIVSFGDFVRATARTRNLPESRSVLQELGAVLIAELGETEFVRLVLAQADQQRSVLVVDGVRHVEIMEAVRAVVAPRPAHLIFLDVAVEERSVRVAKAQSVDIERLPLLDGHSTEVQIYNGRLLNAADLTLDAHVSVDVLVAQALQFLREQFAGSP